ARSLYLPRGPPPLTFVFRCFGGRGTGPLQRGGRDCSQGHGDQQAYAQRPLFQYARRADHALTHPKTLSTAVVRDDEARDSPMGGGELDQHSLCRKEHDDSGDYGCLSGPLEDAANAAYAAARHGSHCSDRRVRRSGSCAGCSSLCALDRDIHVPVAHPRFACSTELADVIRARPGGRLLSGRITLHRAGGPQETGDGGWRDVRHVSNRFRRPAARCIASDDLFHAVDDYARTSRTAWLNVATRPILTASWGE